MSVGVFAEKQIDIHIMKRWWQAEKEGNGLLRGCNKKPNGKRLKTSWRIGQGPFDWNRSPNYDCKYGIWMASFSSFIKTNVMCLLFSLLCDHELEANVIGVFLHGASQNRVHWFHQTRARDASGTDMTSYICIRQYAGKTYVRFLTRVQVLVAVKPTAARSIMKG